MLEFSSYFVIGTRFVIVEIVAEFDIYTVVSCIKVTIISVRAQSLSGEGGVPGAVISNDHVIYLSLIWSIC
jgi:hypothetical protein